MFLCTFYPLVQRHKFPFWSERSEQYEQVEDKSLVACNLETSEIFNSYYLNFVLWEGKDAFWKSWAWCYKCEWGINLLEHLLLLPENKMVLAYEWGYMKIYCVYLVEIFHSLTIYRKERYFKRWSIFICMTLDVCLWRTWNIRKIENTRLWSVREEMITR